MTHSFPTRRSSDLEPPGAYPLHDAADHASLARRVAAFKDHDDPRAGRLHPGLQVDEVNLKPSQLELEILPLHLRFRGRGGVVGCFGRSPLLVGGTSRTEERGVGKEGGSRWKYR